MKAYMKLNRLAVFRQGRKLYDEAFHDGVNIIHGSNGSGKSTIADFIFYVLGGDLREWREFAGLAEFVIAELMAGASTLTIRREISVSGQRPMSFFFGHMEDALLAGPAKWQLAPYKRPETGLSFSQIMFRAIGLPDAIGEGSSNITMHQILRILYSDQLTPVQRIFRVENFDTWQTRQVLGDLLCGIGGYDLYDRQISLRELIREYEEIASQLKSLQTVAATYGKEILVEHVEAAARKVSLDREELELNLQMLLAEPEENVTEKTLEFNRSDSRRELGRARKAVASLEDELESLEFEINDGSLFLGHLEQSLSEFDDAAVTFFALGAAKFEFCPSCFSTIKELSDHGVCELCGSPSLVDQKDAKALAVRLDLEMQFKESRQLQLLRQQKSKDLSAQLRTARAHLHRLAESDVAIRRSTDIARDTLIADLSRKIGFLDRELTALGQRAELAKEMMQLYELKAATNERVARLKEEIQAITIEQEKRKRIAYTLVSEMMKQLLDRDLKDQSDFNDVKSVTFDFAGDWLAVNGDKNRAGSASGMVILKNSFSMALLISSLLDDEFGLPRFMLMDNIEDKGMIQERSWNFQRLIISETATLNKPHQVIFTTSKIAPELDGTPYVVGRKYTRERPCLEFAESSNI